MLARGGANRLDVPEPGPGSRTSERADPDAFIDWLLASLELETTVFHVGQYCGNWSASTAGRALASYHLVLRGDCFVHVAGRAPIALGARDAVFFLRDTPHFLSPEANATRALASSPMEPLSKDSVASIGLACGFFHFRGALSQLLTEGLPDYVVIRADTEAFASTRALFDLILAEGNRAPDAPSPVVARLADLLFFYVLRYVARTDSSAAGLWALIRKPELARLVEGVLKEPGKSWTIDAMARSVGMSRASFFKHFEGSCGTSPGQFLLLVRMRIAARRLLTGESASEAAEHVGYQSLAAFSRAFKKVIGEQPSAYRRGLSAREHPPAAIADF